MKNTLFLICILFICKNIFAESVINIEDKHLQSLYPVITYFLNTVDDHIERLPNTRFGVSTPDLDSAYLPTSIKYLKEDMTENNLINIRFDVTAESFVSRMLIVISYNIDTNKIESSETFNEDKFSSENSISHYFRLRQNQEGWLITSTDYGSTNLTIISDHNDDYDDYDDYVYK